eukprot:1151913-Pelagomonas_calceolata.AAC.13
MVERRRVGLEGAGAQQQLLWGDVEEGRGAGRATQAQAIVCDASGDKVPDSMVTIIASLYSINTTGGPKCTPDSFAALTSQRKPHCGHALLRLKAWGATSNRRTPSAHTVQKSDEQDNGNSVHTHAGVQAMTW